jgi:molybdate transport system ATP-binding protein
VGEAAAREGLAVRLHQAGPIPLDIALTCKPGEMLALVGPSGAGKSTILRSICGLYRPGGGQVTCDGETWLDTARSIALPAHRRRAGLVFQAYALFPHMTALGNIMAAMSHRPRAEQAGRARALVETVHLTGLEDRKPGQLSGGQQQRVALARALARDPAVLLLDEPFSAVDRRTRRGLHDELQQLRRALRIPIVLVTHDLDEAVRLADRLAVIDRGSLLQIGDPDEVVARPADQRVRDVLDLPTTGDRSPREAPQQGPITEF